MNRAQRRIVSCGRYFLSTFKRSDTLHYLRLFLRKPPIINMKIGSNFYGGRTDIFDASPDLGSEPDGFRIDFFDLHTPCVFFTNQSISSNSQNFALQWGWKSISESSKKHVTNERGFERHINSCRQCGGNHKGNSNLFESLL